MPIRHEDNGWYWGGRGPFGSRNKARQVARAAYARGYEGRRKRKRSKADETAARQIARRKRKKGCG